MVLNANVVMPVSETDHAVSHTVESLSHLIQDLEEKVDHKSQAADDRMTVAAKAVDSAAVWIKIAVNAIRELQERVEQLESSIASGGKLPIPVSNTPSAAAQTKPATVPTAGAGAGAVGNDMIPPPPACPATCQLSAPTPPQAVSSSFLQ
jgi:hypothetical protein